MIWSRQLHNIAVRNVGNVYQKTYFIVQRYRDDLGSVECFTDTHLSHFLPWGLQITFSSQSYYENLTCILRLPQGAMKFEFSPISSPTHQKGKNLPDLLTEWQHKSRRNHSGSSLCGLPFQQGHFASIGSKGITTHSLMWGRGSRIRTSTAWRGLWLPRNPSFTAFCGWTPMEKYHSDEN